MLVVFVYSFYIYVCENIYSCIDICIYISVCVCLYIIYVKKLMQIGEADPRRHTLLVFIFKRRHEQGLGEMPLDKKLQSSVC